MFFKHLATQTFHLSKFSSRAYPLPPSASNQTKRLFPLAADYHPPILPPPSALHRPLTILDSPFSTSSSLTNHNLPTTSNPTPVQAPQPNNNSSSYFVGSFSQYLRKCFGRDGLSPPPSSRVPWPKALRASIGSCLCIASVSVPHHLIHPELFPPLDFSSAWFMLLGSFGASAALIAAVPQSPFSQPWAVVGGHSLCAAAGVAAFSFFGPEQLYLACPAAVMLSTLLMLLTGCFHPPGAATGLIAVLGPQAVHDLGWSFVLCPAASAPLCLALTGIVYNNLFSDIKYPSLKLKF